MTRLDNESRVWFTLGMASSTQQISAVARRYARLSRLGYCNLAIADQERLREMGRWLKVNGGFTPTTLRRLGR